MERASRDAGSMYGTVVLAVTLFPTISDNIFPPLAISSMKILGLWEVPSSRDDKVSVSSKGAFKIAVSLNINHIDVSFDHFFEFEVQFN